MTTTTATTAACCGCCGCRIHCRLFLLFLPGHFHHVRHVLGPTLVRLWCWRLFGSSVKTRNQRILLLSRSLVACIDFDDGIVVVVGLLLLCDALLDYHQGQGRLEACNLLACQGVWNVDSHCRPFSLSLCPSVLSTYRRGTFPFFSLAFVCSLERRSRVQVF